MSSLEVSVTGAARIRQVAAQIKTEGRKDLSRQMSDALTKATDPVQRSIRAAAAESMPHGGGYSGLLDKSLRFRRGGRGGGQQAEITLTVYADGKSERRDVPSLNAGQLRHPIFGHRKTWAVTSVRAGFFDRGTDSALDEVQQRMLDVAEDFARRLIE